MSTHACEPRSWGSGDFDHDIIHKIARQFQATQLVMHFTPLHTLEVKIGTLRQVFEPTLQYLQLSITRILCLLNNQPPRTKAGSTPSTVGNGPTPPACFAPVSTAMGMTTPGTTISATSKMIYPPCQMRAQFLIRSS